MANKQERSIKISQDMMEILEDMVLGGGATSVEEALDNIFTDWLLQSTAEIDAVTVGKIAVDSGQIAMVDAQFDVKEECSNYSEGALFDEGQIVNDHGIGVGVVIDTCADGFYEVRKEDWGEFDRIIIDIPKVNHDEDDEDDEDCGDYDYPQIDATDLFPL